jgi:hypothetical protein
MLLDSFALLARADNGFRDTYLQLEDFAKRHADWKWIDPVTVSKDLPLLDAFDLGAALTQAVERGVLRIKYTVLTPDGVLASDAFDSPGEIPRQLPDRFEVFFDTRVRPLVTVFEEAKSAAPAQRADIAAQAEELKDEDENGFLTMGAE